MDTVEERLTKKWKDGESVTKLIDKYGPIENMAWSSLTGLAELAAIETNEDS